MYCTGNPAEVQAILRMLRIVVLLAREPIHLAIQILFGQRLPKRSRVHCIHGYTAAALSFQAQTWYNQLYRKATECDGPLLKRALAVH